MAGGCVQALFLPVALLYLGACILLLRPGSVSSLVLCDGDCANATEPEVCQPFPDRIPLRVMALFPCDVPSYRGRGLPVAAQMAVRAILRNESILPNYRIDLVLSNTMCSGVEGVRAFITQLLGADTRYMIIGPGCSTGALRIAEVSPFYNLTEISYTATSITLSDTRRFPNFFRTIPSDNASIPGFQATIREFGWQQVAIISQRNEVFDNLTVVMRAVLENDGVRVLTERLALEPGITDTRDIVQQLNTSGARIVILNVFEDIGREIFCAAYMRGMVYPRYVFLSYYWYSEFWWRDTITRGAAYTYDPPNCTAEELEQAIFRSISPDYYPEAPPEDVNATSDVGYTPFDFWEEFVSNIGILNFPLSDAIRQARYVYDSVWAAALALHRTSEKLESGAIGGEPVSLTDFNTSRGDINDLIVEATRAIKFRGVSGNVAFNRFGDRETTIQFFQYRFSGDGTGMTLPDPFARLDPVTQEVKYSPGESLETVFPDGIPEAARPVLIHHAQFGIYTFLAGLGIIFAVVCFIFNIVFRKKQVVKLSSPYLNLVIIIGAIFLYVTVIIIQVDMNVASTDTVDALCQTQIWIATLGFSLFFGTMLAKTWRVYYIFSSVKLKRKPLKDWILLLMVAVLLAVDLLFLIIVTPWRLRLTGRLVSRDNGEIPLLFDECEADEAVYWLPVLLAYKGILLLIGIFLAIETYNVKIKELRDSKLIVVSVFFIAVTSVVDTVIALLPINNPNYVIAIPGILGGSILILATGVLVLLFVPKMIGLWHNPSGEVQLTTVPEKPNTTRHLTSNETHRIDELKETVDRLKSQIEMAKSRKPKYQPMTGIDSEDNLLEMPEKQLEPKERVVYTQI